MRRILCVFSLIAVLTACGTDTDSIDSLPAIEVTLTYNSNLATGGTVPNAVTVEAGSVVVVAAGSDLRRAGYDFDGWNSLSDGTGIDYAAGSELRLNENRTLYAKWSAQIDDEDGDKNNKMKITVGSATFAATLADNSTAKAFKLLLPLSLTMNELNGNEKYCYLTSSLPSSATSVGTINAGDLMLYGTSCVVLFYDTFRTSYSYTPIATMSNTAGLKAALGSGNVIVGIELDSSQP